MNESKMIDKNDLYKELGGIYNPDGTPFSQEAIDICARFGVKDCWELEAGMKAWLESEVKYFEKVAMKQRKKK